MSEYFPEPKYLAERVKVELDMSSYATEADLIDAAGVDTSKFAQKNDLANLKSDVVKLDDDKLKNVPTNSSSLKSKVDKLDVANLVLVPIDLRKLSNVVKIYVVEKDTYNAKIKNIECKIADITTNLATNASLNAEIKEIIMKYLVLQTKITKVGNLSKKLSITQKIVILKKKKTDQDHNNEYITTPEFNTLTEESFAARNLKQSKFSK